MHARSEFDDWDEPENFFQGASGIFSFAIHYSLNGHIEVEGDTARARWYLFMPCTVAAGNQAVWRAGIDHETYARVDGTWLTALVTPYYGECGYKGFDPFCLLEFVHRSAGLSGRVGASPPRTARVRFGIEITGVKTPDVGEERL
jgi:hypothetical protein